MLGMALCSDILLSPHAHTISVKLIADPSNKASLDLIDSALFAISLEVGFICCDSSHRFHYSQHTSPTSLHDVSRTMLHGDARNRWFDKVGYNHRHRRRIAFTDILSSLSNSLLRPTVRPPSILSTHGSFGVKHNTMTHSPLKGRWCRRPSFLQ